MKLLLNLSVIMMVIIGSSACDKRSEQEKASDARAEQAQIKANTAITEMINAQNQSAADKQRAQDAELGMKSANDQAAKMKDLADQRYSWMVIAYSICIFVFFVGLVIGMGLGSRTKKDYYKQIDEPLVESASTSL